MIFRAAARKIGWSLLERRASEWSPQDTSGHSVVFSPHYDDETLGAGAAILKLRQLGAPVRIVFMTDGSRSHAAAMSGSELSALRRQEGARAAAALRVEPEEVSFLEYPETKLAAHREDAIRRVTEHLASVRYTRILVPSKHEPDIWSPDHRVTTDIVFAALGRLGRKCEVVEYLVWFWYHWPWVPVLRTGDTRQILKLSWDNAFGLRAPRAINASVELTAFRSQKRAALEQHRTQMARMVADKPWPVLADVARGEFLANFFRTREWFKVTTWEGFDAG